ncbi:MAG TPA: translocation/assembly module TamB domain-containing protein [Vicinamibacterales bacterium]|nr:translocation/assembly module TamB domain-containing protein [Vicinamibacterales bacterium]
MTLKSLVAVFSHPLTQRTRVIWRRTVATLAVAVAVAVVTAVRVDLGPALKNLAETQGSRFVERPMHIGRLSVRLWNGQFELDDFVIEGLTPQSPPFLTVKRLRVGLQWGPLFARRVVLSSIDMDGWAMFMEQFPDGKNSFPGFSRGRPRGRSAWTTTLRYVRARNGETTYTDYGTPWSVVTRRLDITVARVNEQYRGLAKFSGGTAKIQDYEPFDLDMNSAFTVDGGRLLFSHIDLDTDGTRTRLVGDTNLNYFPEQMYRMESEIDFPWMRKIFFAKNDFSLSGKGTFTGTFHLFRETMPGGRVRTGRELKGTFKSHTAGLNTLHFGDLRGALKWVPESLEVTDTTSTFYGGDLDLKYTMAPLGQAGVTPIYTFDAAYQAIDLETFSDYLEMQGMRLAGTASGRNHLEWPRGRWADKKGEGELQVTPPDGAELQTREIPVDRIAAREAAGEPFGPFSNHRPLEPVPLGGAMTYTIEPDWIRLGRSRLATPTTLVEFEGSTAYGNDSRIPFHVTTSDWQESDRLMAGILTAFGAQTGAIEIGGYGTFDGTMLNAFKSPRIEGVLSGEHMRAWGVDWGAVKGKAVVENSYVDVTDVVIGSGGGEIRADGRFSAGFPRRDGGEEINARIRVTNWPVENLRRAFGILDYNVDGVLTGEFHPYGPYQRPLGFGTMTITKGVAYGEPFDSANASVRFEGDGVRLDSIQIAKGDGRGTGAAYVGWNGTYSFNLDGRAIPIEAVSLSKKTSVPLSGLIDFTAGGSGSFDAPRYTVRTTVRDLFAGDEGIGQMTGEIGVTGDLMTVKLEVASSRLSISGSGRVALTPEMDTELSFRITDTSLDPYIRAFEPRLSPYTTAVASGSIRVVGELADLDHLLVDATVDRLDARLFDYQVRNAAPIHIALDRHIIRFADFRLAGEDTELEISGTANLHDERIAVRLRGDTNLGLLQGFLSNVRSSGRASLQATLDGNLSAPLVNGAMTVQNGRIRHFDLPNALENILGPIRFDSRTIRLDELTARLGGGPVAFGGTIGLDGYQLGRIDVTMTGEQMRLRFPEGVRSIADAQLAVRGTPAAATLSGTVDVREAVYTRPFNLGNNFVELGAAAAAAGGAAGPSQTTLPLRYDVQINAPSTLQVRNNVVQLVARANMQLRGTYDRPQIFGRAEVDRGEFLFEGKRYRITRGSMDQANPTKFDPFMDFEMEAQVRVPGETYRVTITLNGTVDRALPGFSSDPPLPEAEILALLFSDVTPGQDVEFRRYSTDVTPQQQLIRERATRVLTGAVTNEVDRVAQQALGVDTFQLTPSLVDPNAQSSRLDPGARLTIGKRLSTRLYLTYSRSLSSSTRDQIVLLEYDQTDQFSWILSRNEDGTYALDVRMRRAF